MISRVRAIMIGTMVLASVACVPTGTPASSPPSSNPTTGEHETSGGATPSDPIPSPSSEPAAGISEEAAVAIALDAVPEAFAAGEVRNATAGPLRDIVPAADEFDWSRGLPPDRWIWSIFLVTDEPIDENAAMVYLDFIDGTVYDVSTGFAD